MKNEKRKITMKNIKYNKTKNKEKGVASIHITMMIMIISLSMVLGLAVIFIGHLRIIRGMGNSVVAFYAASSGIERLLYLNDKVCDGEKLICPAYCNQDGSCFGLILPFETSSAIGAARYDARLSVTTTAVTTQEHFESIGIFEESRRAIRATR